MQHYTPNPNPAPLHTSTTCDICHTTHPTNDPEGQEFTHIKFTAGYGSIFGDGNTVEVDICQHCLKSHLAPFLRISEPAHHPCHHPCRSEIPEDNWTHLFPPASK